MPFISFSEGVVLLSLNFYELELMEQMMVGSLEDIYKLDFKKALEIFAEYREVAKNLTFSAEENVALIMAARSEKVTGKAWMTHIGSSVSRLNYISEKNSYLSKFEKIQLRKDNKFVEAGELDDYELEVVETLMVAYRFSMDDAMNAINKYLLEIYELSKYYNSPEELAIFLSIAVNDEIPLRNAIEEAERQSI